MECQIKLIFSDKILYTNNKKSTVKHVREKVIASQPVIMRAKSVVHKLTASHKINSRKFPM